MAASQCRRFPTEASSSPSMARLPCKRFLVRSREMWFGVVSAIERPDLEHVRIRMSGKVQDGVPLACVLHLNRTPSP